LAIIDTWDGSSGGSHPDFFNVSVDGSLVFSETFANFLDPHTQSYTGLPLVGLTGLAVTPSKLDSAYAMALHDIPHWDSTMVVSWWASGAGWQGGDDESWAIDNVDVTLNASAGDLTVSTNTTLGPGEYTYDELFVTGGATLSLNGAVTLNCANLTIDADSRISANGRGFGAASGPGAGGNESYWGGGGGYGGPGGKGANSSASGGVSYGSFANPVDMGSGGGRSTYYTADGGAGGGAIRLTVSGTLTVNGSLTANGNDGQKSSSPYGGGGGSGGSIYVTTGALTGEGVISANGGNGAWYPSTCKAGGGGGGRIALYYDAESFTGTISAYGGSGFATGGAGTIFTKFSSQASGGLTIDNGGLNGETTSFSLPEPQNDLTLDSPKCL